MKQFLLAICCFLFTLNFVAQELPYDFEVLTGQEYVPLDIAESQSLNQGQTWDDPQYQLGIGFNWFFMDASTFQLFFVPFDGYGAMLAVPTTSDSLNLIIPYLSDIIDAGYANDMSLSPILKQTTGEPGSRIMKLEWQNVAFYDEYDQFETATNRLSFQLWIYEGSNDFEFRFGPNSIKDYELVHANGLTTGIFRHFNPEVNNFSSAFITTGEGNSPVITTMTDIMDFNLEPTLTSDPSNGIVYRFSNGPLASIEDQDQNLEFTIFSRYENQLSIAKESNQAALVTIRSITGQVVKQFNINSNAHTENVSDLSSGVYLISLEENGKIKTLRYVKG